MKLPRGTEKPAKRWGRIGTATVALIVLGWGISSARAGQPFWPRQLPGLTVGEANIRWIAPYVLATTYRVDRTSLTTVRWFDDSGRIVKELDGPNLDPRSECIFEPTTNGTTVYDVNGKWKLAVPQKPGPAGYITGSGDVFVHEFHPVEGQVAVDVYLQGRLVGTAGPFVQYFPSDVQWQMTAAWRFSPGKLVKSKLCRQWLLGQTERSLSR